MSRFPDSEGHLLVQRTDLELRTLVFDPPIGGSGLRQVHLIICHITLDCGTQGLGFSYVLRGDPRPVVAAAEGFLDYIRGSSDLHHPAGAWRQLAGTLNRTRLGPNAMALAAVDLALWDAFANRLDLPLSVVLGGSPRPVRVYGSSGFAPRQPLAEIDAVVQSHLHRGLQGIKPRVTGSVDDLRLIAHLRESLDIELMVDANEQCTPATAGRLLDCARDHGVLFVEEPLPTDAWEGYRRLAVAHGPRLALGEHLQSVGEAVAVARASKCAVLQPDLAAMGGITPCMRLMAAADANNIEVAPHFLPGLFIHLAAAASNVTWLEEFPVVERAFEGWPELAPDGTMQPRDTPGHGLVALPA